MNTRAAVQCFLQRLLQHLPLTSTAGLEVQLLVNIKDVAEGEAILLPPVSDSCKAEYASRKQKLVEIHLTINHSKSHKATG